MTRPANPRGWNPDGVETFVLITDEGVSGFETSFVTAAAQHQGPPIALCGRNGQGMMDKESTSHSNVFDLVSVTA